MIRDEVTFFDTRERQRRLANSLGEAFDITNARDWEPNFSLWVACPHAATRERFGLTQEVLVLYSPFPETDARVLTAIERAFQNGEFKHRLDRVLVILLHDGDQEATEDLVRTQIDRVIVPIRASDLEAPQRGDLFLRSTIACALGTVDLFGMSSPIKSDKYFFGRDQLVRDLVNRSVVHGQNSGVFGLRKTGKTSVLFAIQRHVSAAGVRAV